MVKAISLHSKAVAVKQVSKLNTEEDLMSVCANEMTPLRHISLESGEITTKE